MYPSIGSVLTNHAALGLCGHRYHVCGIMDIELLWVVWSPMHYDPSYLSFVRSRQICASTSIFPHSVSLSITVFAPHISGALSGNPGEPCRKAAPHPAPRGQGLLQTPTHWFMVPWWVIGFISLLSTFHVCFWWTCSFFLNVLLSFWLWTLFLVPPLPGNTTFSSWLDFLSHFYAEFVPCSELVSWACDLCRHTWSYAQKSLAFGLML